MPLAVLLALNPFRDIPIVTLRLQGSACRTIPLHGLSRFETLAGFFRGQCSPRQPSRECLSDARVQMIALQIQSDRRLLEVMKVVPFWIEHAELLSVASIDNA